MYSQECLSIIEYLKNSGVAFNQPTESQINGGIPGITHVTNSYHYKPGTGANGRGVDITGPNLRAIYDAFDRVYTQIAELILNKNGLSQNVKNGKHVPIYDTAPNASNHVHVGVELGVFLAGVPAPQKGVNGMVAYDPISGGNWTVDETGAVFTDAGAPYCGGLNGRKDLNIDPGVNGKIVGIAAWKGDGTDQHGNGYVIVYRFNGSPTPSWYHANRSDDKI